MTQTLWEIESDFIRLMARIKQRGIKIDTKFARAKSIEGTRILNQIRSELGWNPGSPQQIGKYLIDELHLPVVKRTPNGVPSFDKEALEEYELHLDATGDETRLVKSLIFNRFLETVQILGMEILKKLLLPEIGTYTLMFKEK